MASAITMESREAKTKKLTFLIGTRCMCSQSQKIQNNVMFPINTWTNLNLCRTYYILSVSNIFF